MTTFARPIIVTPLASQPGAPAYQARGVWESKPIDVALEGGGILSSQAQTIGVKANEFAVLPAQGDRIEVPAAGAYPRVGNCIVEDTDDDGQGGVVITVKVLDKPKP